VVKCFYDILEVSQSATSDEIRSAYLTLVREYHRDRVLEHLTKLCAHAHRCFGEPFP
jgi:curved DNA-binding protein CbpA